MAVDVEWFEITPSVIIPAHSLLDFPLVAIEGLQGVLLWGQPYIPVGPLTSVVVSGSAVAARAAKAVATVVRLLLLLLLYVGISCCCLSSLG